MENHMQSNTQMDPEDGDPGFRIFYSLPFLRFSVLVRILIVLDALTVLSLWIAGGNSDYFIHNITQFGFLDSVFDLAVMAALKVVMLLAVYYLMENFSLQYASNSYDEPVKRKKNTTHFLAILLSLAFFVYAVVKGGLILNSYLNDKHYVPMHLTYNLALGFAVGFSLIEFIESLYSSRAMRKIMSLRILHRINEDGEPVDEQGQAIKKPANIKRLISLAKPESLLLTGGILCLFLSSGSNMLAPLFFGQVVDAAQKSMADLNRTVLILLAIYIGGAIAGCFRSWSFTLAGQRLVARLRSHLFTGVIQQEVAFFDMTRTGELTNRLASDTTVIQNAVTVNISMLARNLLQILGSLVVMFILNPSLTGVLLAVVPIISIAAVQYGKFLRKLQQSFQDRLADASTTAEEVISSIRTVRTFTSEKKASDLYWQDVEKSYKVGKRLAFLQGLFEGIIGAIASGAIVLVLWYGGKLVNERVITAGQVTSFLLYTLQVAIAFGTLSSLYGDFMKAVGASVRVFELLDRKPKIPVEGGITHNRLNGRIEFRDVHFTYPSRPETEVLKGVSFYVKPGQMVALVGPSGGGKSTIVNLIERFYDPNKGSILLDDMPVSGLDPLWFRRQLSMVSQEPTLFACSIKDNISYGKTATMDEIIDAAKQANAHDFITSFEEGYDTLVGERGVRLSGGQKQRIAIARALIMDPKILLLDEATSALDAESEHLVQEAIDRAMQSRTVIVIAHRLSTVRNASQVMVINKGVICEQGMHEELIAHDGIYKQLILRQLTAGNINGASVKENQDEKTDVPDMIDLRD